MSDAEILEEWRDVLDIAERGLGDKSPLYGVFRNGITTPNKLMMRAVLLAPTWRPASRRVAVEKRTGNAKHICVHRVTTTSWVRRKVVEALRELRVPRGVFRVGAYAVPNGSSSRVSVRLTHVQSGVVLRFRSWCMAQQFLYGIVAYKACHVVHHVGIAVDDGKNVKETTIADVAESAGRFLCDLLKRLCQCEIFQI